VAEEENISEEETLQRGKKGKTNISFIGVFSAGKEGKKGRIFHLIGDDWREIYHTAGISKI